METLFENDCSIGMDLLATFVMWQFPELWKSLLAQSILGKCVGDVIHFRLCCRFFLTNAVFALSFCTFPDAARKLTNVVNRVKEKRNAFASRVYFSIVQINCLRPTNIFKAFSLGSALGFRF